MSGDMAHARALKKCPDCGREVTGNNLARHRATHTNGSSTNGSKPGRKKGHKTTAKEKAGRAATVAIGNYLDELAQGGKFAGSVSLGALAGFPTHTDDPAVVDEAANAIEARADEATSRIVELKLRQRVANLRTEAQALRDVETGEDAEAQFIAVGASWAEQNGITYEVFREMGVPARVLKEAGIAR